MHLSFCMCNLRLNLNQRCITAHYSCWWSFRKAVYLLLLIILCKSSHIKPLILIMLLSMWRQWNIFELLTYLIITNFYTLMAILSLIKHLLAISRTRRSFQFLGRYIWILIFFGWVKNCMLEGWFNQLTIIILLTQVFTCIFGIIRM